MTPEEFTKALSELGFKQSEFARRCGLTPATVSRWALGQVTVPKWVGHHLQLLQDIRRMWYAYVFQNDPAQITPPANIQKHLGKEDGK